MSLKTDIREAIAELLDDLSSDGVTTSATVTTPGSGQDYNVETGATDPNLADEVLASAGVDSGVKSEFQEVIAELFEETLFDEGIVATAVITTIDTTLVYDPETGSMIPYVAPAPPSDADGALWFDDEDNSHWLAAF